MLKHVSPEKVSSLIIQHVDYLHHLFWKSPYIDFAHIYSRIGSWSLEGGSYYAGKSDRLLKTCGNTS